MKRVAFVFSSAPHGSAAGREGLDALLATSTLTDDIGVFLWATACFSCYPNSGLALCWPATTSLPLNCCRYMISTSAGYAPTQLERGLDPATPWVVDVECLAPDALRARLHEFDVILRF